MRDLTPLCEIANKHKTDKGGRHFFAGDTCHEYTPVYYDLLHNARHYVHSVLEIGVNYGCSLRMWRDFFPEATVIGFDSNAGALFTEERIKCYAADQGREDDLLRAMFDVHQDFPAMKFNLIVDDGSHETAHQILTMKTLLPYLELDGVYVIEDLQVDCKPEIIGEHVPAGFEWLDAPCEPGLGKAMCGCGCGEPERLLIIKHKRA